MRDARHVAARLALFIVFASRCHADAAAAMTLMIHADAVTL